MTTHSSILAWGIPWREEPGGLQSMRLQESDMTERLNDNIHTYTRMCMCVCELWQVGFPRKQTLRCSLRHRMLIR